MTVRPVFLNGMIQNTQDVGAMKQQENNRPAVEQQNIQVHEEKKEMSRSQEVHTKDDADNHGKKYDAKEKGANEYYMNRKKTKKEKKEAMPDGTVKMKMSGGFDIRI